MAYRTSRTSKKDALFLEALMAGSSVSRACEAANYTRSAAYRWRNEDPDFAAAWDEAEEAGTDRLEDEAYRRAHDGVVKDILSPLGFKIGEETKYSDTLLIFLLKGKRRKKYGDRVQVDITRAAERLAAEIDVDASELIAEAERIAANAR